MDRFAPFIFSIILMHQQVDASPQPLTHIPDRDEIVDEYKWQLQDIYTDESAWQQDFAQIKTIIADIEQYKGKLSESADSLLACLTARDKLGIVSGKLYAYARLHRDENSSNTKYQAMTGKIETMLAQVGAAISFIEPEILTIPEQQLSTFLHQNSNLSIYKFYLENLFRQKKHILSPSEEKILSLAENATQASENIFNMLAHADIEFPVIQDEHGNNVQLSEGRYQTFIKSPNRTVRQQAFEKLLGTYNKYRNTFAASLNGNVKKDGFYSNVRKYDSTLGAALETDNVPPAVYDNLIATVHNNLEPLHRYIELKRKVLKLKEMHMYDLYTPLVPKVNLEIEYNEALKMVKDGLAPLGENYIQILEQAFNSRWIDVYENKGKQTGAYSFGIYSVHPFVLLNYNRRYEAVSTLAHEMGHAIHSYLSQSAQAYINSNYTIFCAEVASTTNEILLLDYMLANTKDEAVKIYLINQYLEAARTTVYRQTMFAEFEKIIHQVVQDGETLTADYLDNIWHELNQKYYGPNMVVDKAIDVEWARIPHFYSSFYVYQYATGYSAAIALAEQIQQQGLPAQQKYIEFLKSGGSDYSINLLKKAGVDMTSPKPIEVTLEKFNQRLQELEQLLK